MSPGQTIQPGAFLCREIIKNKRDRDHQKLIYRGN